MTPTAIALRERAAALVIAQIPDLAFEPHVTAARGIVTELLAAEVADRTTRTLVLLAGYTLGLADVSLGQIALLDTARRLRVGGLVLALVLGDERRMAAWCEGTPIDRRAAVALDRIGEVLRAAQAEVCDAIEEIEGARTTHALLTAEAFDAG